ncbi:MAG: transcription elongation factor GreA [Chitinophagales bacterium]|nr:transcription elongation factor GreA [Chitinophagales bacterium]
MSDVIYLTKEGLEKIKKELHELRTTGRSEAAKAIAEAREKGDLSENAEYDAAKDAQGYLERKIAELETAVAQARVIDESKIDTSKVMLLSKVEIKNTKTNKVYTYMMVSEKEASVKEGKISSDSPIGKGLMGKKVGDIAEVETPTGAILHFKVLSISV